MFREILVDIDSSCLEILGLFNRGTIDGLFALFPCKLLMLMVD